MKKILLINLSLIFNQILTKGHVCSEDELIRELREDLEDNGKIKIKGQLDCLRHNVDTSGEVDTEERREAREAAEWNSDCAFEADNDEGMPNWWENF